METRIIWIPIAAIMMAAPPAFPQQSLAERSDLPTGYRAPEIAQVVERPGSGDALAPTLRFAEGENRPNLPRRYGDNYWKEGMIIGVTIATLVVLSTLDDAERPSAGEALGYTLMFGTILGVAGALIGGVFPKY